MAEKEVKKTRKPRQKIRPVDETITLSPTKLTDKEKNKLIDYLKSEYYLLTNKVTATEDSVESAFAKVRDTEAKYEAMEAYYVKAFKYIDSQLTAFHAAVNQATKGGIK